AATLYGTDAANGVVVITTKKGRAGAPRWNVYAETGAIRDYNPYPSSYTLFGHAPATPTTTRTCVLTEVSAGTCVPDSLKSLNVTKEDDLTPLGTGFRQQYGAQLSGGTDAVRFFTGVEWEDEVGVFRMDDVSRRRYLTNGLPLREEWARPNALTRTSLRANVNAAVSPKLDLQVSTNYINSAQRAPQIDNNINGLFFSALGGPGYRTGTGALGEPLNGYGIITPYDMFQYTTTQGINRFIGGGNLSWRPLTWMSNRANVGIDYAARTDQQLCRRNNCPDFGSNRLGFALDYRTNIRNFSVDLGSTATFNPLSWMESRTTVGAQYVNYRFDRNGAAGSTLPPGTQTVTAGAVPFADQAHVLSKTLGLFAEEQLAMRDRLFVTLAVRTDQNSAFGTDFQRVVYPKASVSWILSQERFFPQFTWLDQFRVRAAYGAAGQQPGPNDALRFFQPNTSNIAGVDQPVVQFQALGNQELQPERATEVEAGFDARFRNRLSLELTYYSKVTKDALIATIIPPTVGAGATTRFDNLGSVRNAGAEGLINAQIIDRPAIGWDLTLSGS
ncbi:MAG TPA: TonB-dependent receptor, partial [Vicinamibacterales bacterium]|nr:TonB-dependent receptor [Vicinamibacterales bacterium]